MKRAGTVVVLALALLACDQSPTPLTDAPGVGPDGPSSIDGPRPDAARGFGTISGDCGVLDDTEWNTATPFWFAGTFDFANDRYDELDC